VSTEIITGITEIGDESGSHNKIEGQHPQKQQRRLRRHKSKDSPAPLADDPSGDGRPTAAALIG
jgi:hypothetical protein